MHVGFYLDTAHLGSWDWTGILQGTVALSGTDGSMFRVVHGLASSTSTEVTLFITVAGTTPSATPVSQVIIDDFPDAVRRAHAHNLDVLVFNNAPRASVIEGVQLADQLAQPCIAWCQSGPSRSMADRYAASDAIRRVLCVTSAHADVYRDKRVFEKMTVVYNAIDTGRFSLASEPKQTSQTVCYVGAITADKGLHHLIRAWPQVRASFPDARLVVVGSARLYDRSVQLGPLGVAQPEYERTHLIPHLGNSREEAAERFGVMFKGLLPPDGVRAVMQAATVGVVNPNTYKSLETFCVTAVEMQAAGTAVIGGRRKGLRETVRNGETGLLINTQRDLAPALKRLLANPEEARRMGRHGQQWVTHTFDIVPIVKCWQHLLNAVVSGEPPVPPSFSFKRATPRTIFREGIWRLHMLAGRGQRIAFLDRLLDAVRP